MALNQKRVNNNNTKAASQICPIPVCCATIRTNCVNCREFP